jgi:hypothetical protein
MPTMAEGKATTAHQHISASWRRSLQNSPVSMVSVCGTVLCIGGTFFVSVILVWPTPKISIFGVGYLYTVGTYHYWYRLY